MAEKISKEEHPIAAIVMHWVHLLSFFALILTGLYIHSPIPSVHGMFLIQQIHFISMYVFILSTVARIYWAFFGAGSAARGAKVKMRDYKHFSFGKLDGQTWFEWIKYYLFVRKTKPRSSKYNPLQKGVYGYFFPVAIALMALTGFALFVPTASAMMWFTNLLGGAAMVRLVHYFGMWILIAVFMVHLYLVLFEDTKEALPMLVAWVPRPNESTATTPQHPLPRNPPSDALQVTIIGIGNTLMGDDGVGVAVARLLQARTDLGPAVTVIDGATGGMALSAHFSTDDAVIVIDAIAVGDVPGSVYRLDPDESGITQLRSHTSHGLSLPNLIMAARLCGANPRVIVYAVQIGSITTGFDTLTPEVADALPDIVDLVIAEAAALASAPAPVQSPLG